MARGVGIERMVRKAHELRRREYRYGHWHVEVEGHNLGGTYENITATVKLYHYSTKMLEWHYKPSTRAVEVTGWWVGWGSASDQEGVNAALRTLGSPLRYRRDRAGGGARVNPAYRVSAAVGRSINAITPPVY